MEHPKKPRNEMDGLKVIGTKEFQSFIAPTQEKRMKIRTGTHFTYSLSIPLSIAEFLQLKHRTFVEVAIRLADQQALKDYNFRLPEIRAALYVKCPKCNQIGTVNLYGGIPYIRHKNRRYCHLEKFDLQLVKIYHAHRRLVKQRALLLIQQVPYRVPSC